MLLHLLHRRRAVLAAESASVIHKNDVRFNRMFQNGIQFHGESLFVALESGPAVIAGVKPEERWLGQRGQNFWNLFLAVAF